MDSASEGQFQEQSFFEYHLYTLQRPTTIREQETKQVSLLEASGFDLSKAFELNGQRYYYTGYNNPGQPIKEKVGVYVQFRNSQVNKLGMPLPAGIASSAIGFGRKTKDSWSSRVKFLIISLTPFTPIVEKWLRSVPR